VLRNVARFQVWANFSFGVFRAAFDVGEGGPSVTGIVCVLFTRY